MFDTFAILDLSTPDMLIIFAIVLLLFGSKKLPELARSLGTSARELKKGLGEASQASQELKQQVTKITVTPQLALAEAEQPASPVVTAPTAAAPVTQRTPQSFGYGRRTLIQ